LLELDGFTVRFLGADVPTDSLLQMVREDSPRLVVLSATMTDRLAELRAAVAGLRQAFGHGLHIFVGGQAMDWMAEAMSALEVDLAAREARETLAAAKRLARSVAR
jgi:methanogenic corrinoid protein MtbC1